MLALFRFQKLILFLRSRVLLAPAPCSGSGVFPLLSWLRLLLPILGSLGRFGRGTVQRDLRPVAGVWNEERGEISGFVWYLISCLCWIITWIKWTFQRIKTLGNVQLWASVTFCTFITIWFKIMNTLGGTVGKSDLSRVNLLPASRLSHQRPAASVWMRYDPCRMLRTLHAACVGSAATIISRECCSVEAKLQQVCRSCCCRVLCPPLHAGLAWRL